MNDKQIYPRWGHDEVDGDMPSPLDMSRILPPKIQRDETVRDDGKGTHPMTALRRHLGDAGMQLAAERERLGYIQADMGMNQLLSDPRILGAQSGSHDAIRG